MPALAPSPIQPRLLRVPEFRPMMTIEGVRAALAYTEDEVLADIDDGTLEYALDIGRSEAERRAVRVFAPCVDARREQLLGRAGRKNFGWPEIEATLFPTRADKPFVPSPDLRLALNCSSEMIIYLLDAGDLSMLPGTDYSRGRHGAALVTWKSITKFLRDRRL
jgi:hypothetical protein